jgi:signal transduction histidine kinase
LLVVAGVLVCGYAQAQKEGQALVDSEVAVVSGGVSDSMEARLCNKIATYYQDVNTDSAAKYAGLGMGAATSLKWTRAIAVFNTCYANIFMTEGLLDSAWDRHRKATELYIGIKDSFNIASSYNNLGTIAKARSDFAAATRYFLNTLEMGQALKENFLIGLGSENLALVYEYQEDYPKALEYARKSVAAYSLEDTKDHLSAPTGLIGTVYQHLNEGDSAIFYLRKALSLAREVGNKWQEASQLEFIADYYAGRKDYAGAIQNSLLAQKIWDSVGRQSENAIDNTGVLGRYYLELAKLDVIGRSRLLRQAIGYLEDAVEKDKTKGIRTSQSEFQITLAEADALAGNYKGAYLNYKSYQEIKDSVYSQESKNKIAAAMSKLELDKKNAEIALNKATIVNQHRQQLLLTVGLGLLAVIGVLLYRQSRVRKRSNVALLALNNELDASNKLKAKFFGILSHDLRSPIANLINFLQLQKKRPGLMSEEQIEEREKKISGSAQSLLETMEALLLWSKGQMEQFKPAIALVTVEGLFGYLRRNFSDTGDVVVSYVSDEGLEVRTDEYFLQTVMYNLTANAVKALRQTTDGRIGWKAWRSAEGVFFSIADNGPGASDEQLRALYDETAPSGGRSGLGLHIIRDLAKAIGCRVSYSGGEGAGAEFILCIATG